MVKFTGTFSTIPVLRILSALSLHCCEIESGCSMSKFASDMRPALCSTLRFSYRIFFRCPLPGGQKLGEKAEKLTFCYSELMWSSFYVMFIVCFVLAQWKISSEDLDLIMFCRWFRVRAILWNNVPFRFWRKTLWSSLGAIALACDRTFEISSCCCDLSDLGSIVMNNWQVVVISRNKQHAWFKRSGAVIG